MPTGANTLLETAKTMDIGHSRSVVGTYASAYHPMTAMPILPAPSGVHNWNTEDQLPYNSGGTRAFNGSWTSTRSVVSSFTESIKIYGGEVQIDRMMAKINPQKVPQERAAQVRASARQWTIDFIKGGGGTQLRGIEDWLNNETLFANQTFNVGSASAGSALMTDHLDRLLSLVNIVPGMTYIYCSDQIGLRIQKLSRGNSATNDTAYATRFSPDQWGYFSGMYNNVPVVVLKDGKGTDLIDTDDGDGESSSVYCVTYGTEMLAGFQVGPMEVHTLNQADVYNYFDFEWGVGLAPQAVRSIARLRYVAETVGT